MLAEPVCWNRQCKYYLGVIQSDETEATEVNNCEAFPDGIPEEIAYGNNEHLKVLPNQKNDVIYEEG